MHPLLNSLHRLLIQPLLTTFKTLYSLVIYITPTRLQLRLRRITSVYRQILNLLIGRALPDLTAYIPNTDLTSKNAIITGSNSGIGLQIALELTRRGANVVLACRSPSRGEGAVQHILWNVPEAKGRVILMKLDTSSLDSVKEFAVRWVEEQPLDGAVQGERAKVDILVHNAGISHAPSGKDLTEDGIETIYATNFLGSFLLTYLLEPYLSSSARVIFTSSTGQLSGSFSSDFSRGPVRGVVEPGFHTKKSRVPLLGWEYVTRGDSVRYGMGKAMQCAMARLLQRRWDRKLTEAVNHQSDVAARKKTAHSFTPGFTMTPIFGKFEATSWIAGLLKDPVFKLLQVGTVLATDVDQGAATGAWLACTQDREVVHKGGGHWDRMARVFSVADGMSDEKLDRLWERWERDVGIEWT